MSRWGDDLTVDWSVQFRTALDNAGLDKLANGTLHDTIMQSLNNHVDELDQAIDRLICEGVDLERILRYDVTPSDCMENGLMVDKKKAYTSTTVYEVRRDPADAGNDQHLFVTRGVWVGEFAHLNPREVHGDG